MKIGQGKSPVLNRFSSTRHRQFEILCAKKTDGKSRFEQAVS